MNQKQRENIDNMFYLTNKENIKKTEQIEKKKKKEREKRIKQNKEIKNKNNQFDDETEIVLGMINKNHQKTKHQKEVKMTKKQRQILKKKKRIKRFLKCIVLLILIIGGIVFALVSPIFQIQTINVNNNQQITNETIISLSELYTGQNIFQFNKRKTINNIKENPYIESVEIKRKIPNEVQISIQEREKDFNVEFLNGYAYINKQGYILEISEQKIEAPIIQGIATPEEQVVPGNRLESEDLEKLEVVIQIMNIAQNYDLNTKITNIDISNKNEYTMYIAEEKKTVYLGDKTNLSNKMLYVQAILEKNQGKEGYIYVDGDLNNSFKPRFRESVEV